MPIQICDINPINTGDGGGVQSTSQFFGPPSTAANSVNIGGVGTKPNFYLGAFFIFSLGPDIDNTSVINGCQLRLYASGTEVGTSMTLAMGFLDKDGKWDVGDLTSYANMSEVPWAQADSGAYNDNTVWVDDTSNTFAYTILPNALQLATFGEGISSDYTLTGFNDRLANFVAAQPDGEIRVCILVYRPYIGANQTYQGFLTSNYADAQYRPQLYVDWDTSEVRDGISGKARMSPVISDSKLALEPVMSIKTSKTSIKPVIDGVTKIV